ncbi:MAG: phosphoribosylanthranilate isomerase [Desulfomonile tiedjei]|uniref:N-(5'-phosphoribosyl)anthranilate isomerase n=1 Tax=Desulfomonile tiedjei TaxID=2358 RepID=A0A9D6Z2D0_9BACT|nr:phosphoribosylanthranilate isomerase [Desulfomonile tiedjei]
MTQDSIQDNWPPKIQIAGVSSLQEARFCRNAGVEAVGFTLELPRGPHDGLTTDKAASIIRALPEGLLPVIITYLNSAQAAFKLMAATSGQAVQFHGGIPVSELQVFRRLCPEIRTIGRVTVMGEESLIAAAEFKAPLWDAIILDSSDPATGKIGATGKTHDWSISAQIVRAATVPVILAGGLKPDNVRQAILTVRPHGVDAHTGVENPDGTRDFVKILNFASSAMAAFRMEHSHT